MLSLRDLRRQIEAGTLSCDAAINLARKGVAAREAEIGAFVHLDKEPRARHDGPLAGIAVAVKDNIDTSDMPTRFGSPIYEDWQPRADAAIVAKLRRLGATILGKATTCPFATLDPTATRNPANPAHTPGGSSAGSAASVAAGMVPLAVGTQTGGSVIRPASFCGVAAIKPSFGLIPTVGVKALAWTLDTVGLFAARVADLNIALAAVTGRSLSKLEAREPRIGVLTQDFAGPVDTDAVAALEHAIAALRRAGARVGSATAPDSMREAWRAQPTIQSFEACQSLAWEYDNHRALLPPLLRANLDESRSLAAENYDNARLLAHHAQQQAASLFAEFDALITYSAAGAAPVGFSSTGEARFNRLFTLLGTPCVNVPALRDRNGLPIGTQVVAPYGKDGTALDVGHFLELALKTASGQEIRT
jgi:Asp-tRNA(Asn)/Glu-tRNA(Gln) amidotransferase A subunit family amidase